ncbi:hypothetical protein AMD01_16200 [Priestia koreensis]|uniref:Uncharacterized protein n=2 Tax=Priestia koreensis TaxID=284581 RepID=A0A0M0KVP0_9BACI|nr:hypothetical protein AMD01_16200 [Priestia koreensis]
MCIYGNRLVDNLRGHYIMAKKENVNKPFYKKWWVWVIAAIVLFPIVGGGGEEETTEKATTDVKEEQPKEEKKEELKAVDQEAFKSYASNITGGTFIKNISVTDNKGLVEYYGSFEEYKQANPNSNLTETDYKGYFETGDAIEKILVSENTRLLRQFPELTATSMALPYGGKTYSIDLERKEVNEYLGFKVEELTPGADGSWNKDFNDPIVYDDANRKKFFGKFVEVK